MIRWRGTHVFDKVRFSDNKQLAFGDDQDATLYWDGTNLVLTSTAALTFNNGISITRAGATTQAIGVTSTINSTATYTGWALGFFGTTTLSGTIGVVGGAAGGFFEVNMASTFAGSTSSIVAGLCIGAYGNSTAAKPTCGLWIETIAGTGVSFQASGASNDMPMIALVTSGAGTKSSLAIEFGSEVAGKTVSTGAGGMFQNQTIQVKANGTLYYWPLSTVEGTYTTAYLIQSSLATASLSITTGAVIIAGGVGISGALFVGGGINAAGTTGITMVGTAVTQAIKIGTTGTTAGTQTDGNGVSLATGGNAYAVEVNTDSSGGIGATSVYLAAIRGNFVMGTATAGNNASTIGVLGVLNTNTLPFGGGDHYGVRGHVDHWGTVTMSGANSNTGGVSAFVENEAGITVPTNSVLCGVVAYQVGAATVTGTGLNPAFWIRASSTASKWQYGIYMAPTHVNKVLLAGTQPGEASGDIIDGHGVSLATDYSAGKYSFGTSYRLYALEINADTGSVDMTGDVNAGAIKGRMVIGTTQTNLGASAIVGTLDVAAGKNLISNQNGICAVLDFYGNTTIGGTQSHVSAFSAVVWNEGTTTSAGTNTGGGVFGIEIIQNSGSPTMTGGLNAALHVRGSAWQWGIYGESGSLTNGISLTCSALTATDGRIASFKGTQATPAMADGYGVIENELTVTGTATSNINFTSTWINLGTSAVVPGYITLHTDGIWDGTATLTNAMVSMQKYTCQLASNPAWLSIWELNFQQDANNIINAMFNTNDLARGLGYVAATPTAAAIGSIPFCSVGGGAVQYIRLYADATT